MVSLYRITSFLVYSKGYGVAELNHAVFDTAFVKVYTVGFLGVENGKNGIAESYGSGITYLATALAVEYGLVGNESAFSLRERINRFVLLEESKHLALALVFGISEEFGLGKILEKRFG